MSSAGPPSGVEPKDQRHQRPARKDELHRGVRSKLLEGEYYATEERGGRGWNYHGSMLDCGLLPKRRASHSLSDSRAQYIAYSCVLAGIAEGFSPSAMRYPLSTPNDGPAQFDSVN